ncbi:tRNA (pseudouridine(54)-N(1))-methyltransferase [Candidatus Tiddalikarchaeum anstoanum]|nr:tRNA (pseudouridine(54)-N(1))-methyltransferase [Candidatus Tiddalikarchaeum anstoanum]
MREFLLLASKAKTTPDFDVNNLVGAGRMDLVCRVVSNSLCVSNNIRKDTIIHVSLNGARDPPKLLSVYGDKIIGIQPDEKTIGILIRDALSKKEKTGITVSKISFEAFLKEKIKTHQLVYLEKSGKDIRTNSFKKDVLFILGDYAGLPDKTELFLDNLGAERISLGPAMLLASQCVTIIHNELDRKIV